MISTDHSSLISDKKTVWFVSAGCIPGNKSGTDLRKNFQHVIPHFPLPVPPVSRLNEGLSMDSPATDYIRHRLQKFERTIDDTIRHFPELETFGTRSASAPYDEKCTIPALLDSLSASDPGRAALREEYLRIVQKLGTFADGKGPAYRDLLFEDLRQYTHAYHAAVCHAHVGRISPDTARDLARRELIGELCRELGGYYALSDIVALIAMLDANLPPASVPSPDNQCECTPGMHGSRSLADGEYPCPRPEKKTGHARSE
jgi:hypothetical protein